MKTLRLLWLAVMMALACGKDASGPQTPVTYTTQAAELAPRVCDIYGSCMLYIGLTADAPSDVEVLFGARDSYPSHNTIYQPDPGDSLEWHPNGSFSNAGPFTLYACAQPRSDGSLYGNPPDTIRLPTCWPTDSVFSSQR